MFSRSLMIRTAEACLMFWASCHLPSSSSSFLILWSLLSPFHQLPFSLQIFFKSPLFFPSWSPPNRRSLFSLYNWKAIKEPLRTCSDQVKINVWRPFNYRECFAFLKLASVQFYFIFSYYNQRFVEFNWSSFNLSRSN